MVFKPANCTEVYNTEVTFEEYSTLVYNAELENTFDVYTMLYGIGILIDIVAICGNTLTMVTIAQFRQLRTKSNAIIFSLSFADFMVGITHLIGNIFHLQNEQTLSKVFNQLVTMFVLSSMLHLLIVATERYIFIIYPLKYHTWITKNVIGLMIFLPWLVAFLTYTVPLFMSYLQIPTDVKAFRLTILLVYVAESIAIIGMYSQVLRIVQKQVRQIRNLSFIKRHENISESERKATLAMGLILGAFVISWMPERINSIFIKLKVVPKNKIINMAFGMVGYSNSVVNCFIYAWKYPQFRKAYYSLLSCKKMSTPN